jgi:hypothetical protein
VAKEASGDQHLRAHPLLSKLLEHGPDTRSFRGYVAPTNDERRVTLYPSLGDLTFSLEFDADDIVASAAAPESVLPHGGTVIWVKSGAEVTCRGDQINTVAARQHRRTDRVAPVKVGADNAGSAAGRLVEVKTGRLTVSLRPRVASSCASCSCASCDPHPSCTSNCNEISGLGAVVLGP